MEFWDIYLAYQALAVCMPLLAAAVGAYIAKSRTVFLFALAGCLLSLLVPQFEVRHSIYRSAEAAYMAALKDEFGRRLLWAVIGTGIGFAVGYCIAKCRSREHLFPTNSN